MLNNTQVDKLGQRLKLEQPSEADLVMLSLYRNGFALPARAVFDVVQQLSGLQPTIRSDKTTLSIVAKLKREGIRLSQMQDISGCRVTVENLEAQDRLVDLLRIYFPDSKLHDRCARPAHGYRAKHVAVRTDSKWIEIQIRTTAQHAWALLSEKAADMFGQQLKYGVGDQRVLKDLSLLSAHFANIEIADIEFEAEQGLKILLDVSNLWHRRLEIPKVSP